MNSNYTAANIFTDTYVEQFPRHMFSMPYTISFTANHGYLYPAFCKKVIPGDKINLKSFGRVQLTPLATNTMQNIKVYMRYFYVPYRLLWNKFDEFISQDGLDPTPMLAPYTVLNGLYLNNLMRTGQSRKLLDFLGVQFFNSLDGSDDNFIPYSDNSQVAFTLYKHLAYWLIWDTYFRDENLQNPIFDVSTITSGFNNLTNLANLNEFLPVAKEKDYFTTALPWTQKGEPVNLNAFLVGKAPISFINNTPTDSYGVEFRATGYPYKLNNRNVFDNNSQVIGYVGESGISNPLETNVPIGSHPVSVFATNQNEVPSGDTSGRISASVETSSLSTSISINELRYANALQRYLERLALGGNRPAEFYLSMYGVKVDDLRIGQPQYLGGGSTYVHVTSIAQTAESDTSPLATLAGNGQAGGEFSINEPTICKEFGLVIGMFYIRPELNYTQGISRDMTCFSHLDEYNPIFAHLGEEAVKTSELFIQSDFNNNPGVPENNVDDIFGYQSRYAYLKANVNEIHGELKGSLSKWMLSSHFLQKPVLNSTFIEQPQNYDIFSVIDGVDDHYIVELRHQFEAERSMPDHAIPSL